MQQSMHQNPVFRSGAFCHDNGLKKQSGFHGRFLQLQEIGFSPSRICWTNHSFTAPFAIETDKHPIQPDCSYPFAAQVVESLIAGTASIAADRKTLRFYRAGLAMRPYRNPPGGRIEQPRINRQKSFADTQQSSA
jgi:hypothetical protein